MNKDEWEESKNQFHQELVNNEELWKHNNFIEMNYLGAKEYAQLIIKNLILLNGGIFVALPVLYETFEINKGSLVIAVPYFVISLVSIILTAMLAYFNLNACARSLEYKKNEDYVRVMQLHFSKFYTEETNKNLSGDKENFTRRRKVSEAIAAVIEFAAILCVFASVISFVLGAVKLLQVV